ncbi:MAG: alcohol dehydrogenase catalytic domain-containing protein [Lentisphaeria bacterium]|nr:alcohol dehydrogenase catalytic domain-containing protein [Lentisphaeria bacterium]
MSNIPEKMLAWPLFGTGFEFFGKEDKPCVVNVPEIKDDELLVRIDAIGLCFSDVKLIRAGESHPRVISENLATDPVIPGHEAVMSVVKVGAKLAKQYEVGQRFIIQADIYVNGKGFAYGYAIDGGMAQYSVLDQRVLNGDEGCYLLPVADHMPSAVAALLEPWTCVQAAYMIENRSTPKAGGKMLVVGKVGNTYTAGAAVAANKPASLTVYGLDDAAVAALESELGMKAVKVDALDENEKFDDIFVADRCVETTAKVAKMGAFGAVISFGGELPAEKLSFDVGSIHYQGWFYQGTASRDISSAYGRNVRSTMKAGGSCWLPGGAGAMGQMHTQMAVENPNGPKRILVSDMDQSRIDNVKRLLADKIAERGIEFVAVNPTTMSAEEFEKVLNDFAPEGFDDIVMLVPVVPVLMQSAAHLGKDGLMNIFAGIPAGKEGELDLATIARNGGRYIGSSGSKTAHLRHTLELATSGKLQPVTALAAVGGMQDLKKGLDAVANAKFPGKTVIFPNCEDMPLTPVSQLGDILPDAAATYDEQGFYTSKTEKALLDKFEK